MSDYKEEDEEEENIYFARIKINNTILANIW